MEEQYQMSEKSAINTVLVLEQALEAFPSLDRFLLLEYPLGLTVTSWPPSLTIVIFASGRLLRS